ncbi:MAG: DNA-binding protein [Sulfuritalea sp.]|nr:DNA-binding protein [Sulfuritalea sp.]
MARVSEVSYDDVARICYQILGQGKNPTFPPVYAALGNKGGAKVVQEAISRWRRSVVEVRSRPGVPESIIKATDALADAIWVEAIKSVEQAMEARRQTLEAEALEVRAAAARLEAESVEKIAALSGRLTTAETQLALATQRIANLVDQLADRETQLAARDQTIASQLSIMAEKDAERRQFLAEIERHDVDRRDLLQMVDQVRQEARALDVANSSLTASLGESRDTASRLRAELESVRGLQNAAEGELKVVAARLAETATSLNAARGELKVAQDQVMEAQASRQDLLRRAEVAEATVAAIRSTRSKSRPTLSKRQDRI